MSLLRSLFGRRSPSVPVLEPPWDVLHGTGNGIGRAPAALRSIPDLDDDMFEDLYYLELVDCFYHQGTIYLSTPFAIAEVMQILSRVQPARQEALLAWFRDCLFAESLGEREGSHAGVWLPPRDKAKIASAGLARPTVQEVLAQYLPQFRMFAEEGQSPELRRAAGELHLPRALRRRRGVAGGARRGPGGAHRDRAGARGRVHRPAGR